MRSVGYCEFEKHVSYPVGENPVDSGQIRLEFKKSAPHPYAGDRIQGSVNGQASTLSLSYIPIPSEKFFTRDKNL